VAGYQGRELSATAELAALALAESAPDSETLVVRKCVLEALAANLAGGANLFCFAGRTALFREEGFWVGLGAERVGLPGKLRVVIFDECGTDAGDAKTDRINEPVLRN
jgi:hypothetical protein